MCVISPSSIYRRSTTSPWETEQSYLGIRTWMQTIKSATLIAHCFFFSVLLVHLWKRNRFLCIVSFVHFLCWSSEPFCFSHMLSTYPISFLLSPWIPLLSHFPSSTIYQSIDQYLRHRQTWSPVRLDFRPIYSMGYVTVINCVCLCLHLNGMLVSYTSLITLESRIDLICFYYCIQLLH